jgi:hypothetical protein
MKRIVAVISLLTLILSGPVIGYTIGKNQVVAELASYITVASDGRNIDVAQSSPLLYNGEVYLPAKKIGEALGYQASWDNTTKRLSFSLPADGAPVIRKNGVEIVSISSQPDLSNLLLASGHGKLKVKFVYRVTTQLATKPVFVVDVLDSKKRVVASGTSSTFSQTKPGTYEHLVFSESFPLPFKPASEADTANKISEMYTYRFTVK